MAAHFWQQWSQPVKEASEGAGVMQDQENADRNGKVSANGKENKEDEEPYAEEDEDDDGEDAELLDGELKDV